MRGFFLGFPGCNVQSAFCFLKGRSSRFLQSSLFVLIQPCLGKIIFSSWRVCSSLDEMYFLMSIVALDFLIYSICQFFFVIIFLLVVFSFSSFRCICRRCLCVCLSFYYNRLLFCLFWVCWVSGSFSGGPGHIFFLCGAPLWGLSVRYNLFER